jgi:hypothetical protein
MTVAEFAAGLDGYRDANSLPEDAMTREEFEALAAEYPDEVPNGDA